MSDLEISVILCTHNPRADFLGRTLRGIASQTFPLERSELLVIDNGSTPALREDLSWHPHGRIVREETLGLAHARLRGIAESTAEILVFVDDDNVLHPDYLSTAQRLAEEWPKLGTWGGQTIAEFEEPPAEWSRPYLWLAIREFAEDRWSNVPLDAQATPLGAGICVRRRVAEAYQSGLAKDPLRRTLGRTGNRLLGCEDSDLTLTACDLGLGNGIFARLKLDHLIDKKRLSEDYLLRLVEATTYSHTFLSALRGAPPAPSSRAERLLRWYQSLHISARDRKFDQARRRGAAEALRDFARLRAEHPSTTLPSTPAPLSEPTRCRS